MYMNRVTDIYTKNYHITKWLGLMMFDILEWKKDLDIAE